MLTLGFLLGTLLPGLAAYTETIISVSITSGTDVIASDASNPSASYDRTSSPSPPSGSRSWTARSTTRSPPAASTSPTRPTSPSASTSSGSLGFHPSGNLVTADDGVLAGIDSRLSIPNNTTIAGPNGESYAFHALHDAYLDNYDHAADQSAGAGRINLLGNLGVAFFEDLDVHLRTGANEANTTEHECTYLSAEVAELDFGANVRLDIPEINLSNLLKLFLFERSARHLLRQRDPSLPDTTLSLTGFRDTVSPLAPDDPDRQADTPLLVSAGTLRSLQSHVSPADPGWRLHDLHATIDDLVDNSGAPQMVALRQLAEAIYQLSAAEAEANPGLYPSPFDTLRGVVNHLPATAGDIDGAIPLPGDPPAGSPDPATSYSTNHGLTPATDPGQAHRRRRRLRLPAHPVRHPPHQHLHRHHHQRFVRHHRAGCRGRRHRRHPDRHPHTLHQ